MQFVSYADGERYEGQWHFGKREGFGIYYYLGELNRVERSLNERACRN